MATNRVRTGKFLVVLGALLWSAPAGALPAPLLGDADGSCTVDAADLSAVLTGFGGDEPDLDGDGTVDHTDLSIVDARWGATCGRRLYGDVDGSGVVDALDLNKVLAAFGSDDPSADVNGDGHVGKRDVALVEANWGRNFAARLATDIDGSNVVNTTDLTLVLAAFGTDDPLADADLDGTVGGRDLDLLVALSGRVAGDRLPGDVDGDRVVGSSDLDLVRAVWGKSFAIADLNGDGTVGARDLNVVLSNFGATSGQRLSGDVNGDCLVDDVDLALVRALWGSDQPMTDVNGDGRTNAPDLTAVLSGFGNTCGTDFPGDIDGSNVVDDIDLDVVVAQWGTAYLQADLDGDGEVATGDLLIVLSNFGNEE